MKRMIDEPTPFDTLETWKEFLRKLESISNKDENTVAMIDKAKKTIANFD